jgi:hypothetical protein
MNVKRVIWSIGLVLALLAIFGPFIYESVNSRRQENTIAKVHISFKGWFELYNSQPTVMDYNSSRVVSYYTNADKGLKNLIIALHGKLLFTGHLYAPGFDVATMNPEAQPAFAYNQWQYVLVPKRSGKQLALFTFHYMLADDASDKDRQLFWLWASKMEDTLNKAGSLDGQGSSEIDVIQPWLNLATIVQVVGLVGTLVSTVLLVREKMVPNEPSTELA